MRNEIDSLTASISEVISDKEKRLKKVQDLIKAYALDKFRDGDNKVSIKGESVEFVLSKSTTDEIDKDKLIADGLLDKYSKSKISYRLTTSKIKEDK